MHGVHRLVYYEMHDTFEAAFRRETQMKKWRRLWKIRLIEQTNPQWNDLFDDFWGVLDHGDNGQIAQDCDHQFR